MTTSTDHCQSPAENPFATSSPETAAARESPQITWAAAVTLLLLFSGCDSEQTRRTARATSSQNSATAATGSAPDTAESEAAPGGIDPETGVTSYGLTTAEIRGADISVLLIGNSHCRVGDLPQVLGRLLARVHPDQQVLCRAAPGGGFLIDHAQLSSTRAAIEAGPWDFVVLQALKYSTSGRYEYPFDGAIELTELARKQGAKVIMFPEWRQRGRADEGRRIHALHERLVKTTQATIAPVGLAWDDALEKRPDLQLHAADGNHASNLGARLTAAVLCATISHSAEPPQEPNATHRWLDEVAWRVVRAEAGDDQIVDPAK